MTIFYQLTFTETGDDYKNVETYHTVFKPTTSRDECIQEAIKMVVQDETRAYHLLGSDGKTPHEWLKPFIQSDPDLEDETFPFVVKETHACDQELLDLMHKHISSGEFTRVVWEYTIYKWELNVDQEDTKRRKTTSPSTIPEFSDQTCTNTTPKQN